MVELGEGVPALLTWAKSFSVIEAEYLAMIAGQALENRRSGEVKVEQHMMDGLIPAVATSSIM